MGLVDASTKNLEGKESEGIYFEADARALGLCVLVSNLGYSHLLLNFSFTRIPLLESALSRSSLLASPLLASFYFEFNALTPSSNSVSCSKPWAVAMGFTVAIICSIP